jgi:hypothetical protein
MGREQWSALGSGMSGPVSALVMLGEDLYAGGSFTNAGGVPARGIAKWDGSNWSALGVGINGSVHALAVSGSDLYVGGDFGLATNTGGTMVSVLRIAMWNGTHWSALGLGLNGTSRALAVSSTNLYAGGDFTTAGGFPAHRIAKWNGSSWSALGAGINDSVRALAVSGNDLYVGGSFSRATNSGGVAVTANRIAKWNGSDWSGLGWLDGVRTTVHALAISDSNLYAGGSFSDAGGVAATNIAQWNGSNWSALGSGMNDWVYTLAVSGNELYAGGNFTTAGETGASRIAKWDDSEWSTVGTGLNSSVFALAASSNVIYAGGAFTTVGGVAARRIAKWDGNSWSALGTGMNSTVYALAAAGNDLYAGGAFTWATNGDGTAVMVNRIAKWNGSTWSSLGRGMDNWVLALAASGSDVYAGGYFTTAHNSEVSAVTAYRIAKWDGDAWSALGSGVSSTVNALVVSGGQLYAGGWFTTAGGIEANRVAKWDGTNWFALGTGMDHSVSVLAAAGNDLYAGGSFLTAGGLSANRIARWDGNTWSRLGMGVSSRVTSLVVVGGNLYAAGDFARANSGAINTGDVVNYIAQWDGQTWSALGSGMNSSVHGLAVASSNLYAGGQFTIAGGKVSAYMARASIPVPLMFQRGSLAVSNGAFRVLLVGPPDATVIVDASSDLTHWTPMATNNLPSDGWPLWLSAETTERQFYRARLSP